MSQIAGTRTEVSPDTVANTLIIRIPENGVSVPAEEVIHCLGSESLALRTRKKIQGIVQVAYEGGVVLRVRFKGVWEWWCELDVLDALRALFAQKGYQCVC